jgi:hypothetical protein
MMAMGVMLLLLLALGLRSALVGLEHGHLSFAHGFGAETATSTGSRTWWWRSGVGVGTRGAVASGTGVWRIGVRRGLMVRWTTGGVGVLRLAVVERFLLAATVNFLVAELFELLRLLTLLQIVLLLTVDIHVSRLLMLSMVLWLMLLWAVQRVGILRLLLLMTM